MGGQDGRYETIEHTADLAIQVRSSSLEGLFLAAAHGLVGLLCGDEAGSVEGPHGAPSEWIEVEIEADDVAALLVDWLRELLYVASADGLLFAAAEFRQLEETRVASRVGFRRPAPGQVEREIKGVTYHDLAVERRVDGWYARLVFDV